MPSSPPVPYAERLPILYRLRSSPRFIVTTVAFAIFTDVFLYGAVVPVLPFSLPERVHVPVSQAQYWTSVSLGVFGAAFVATSILWTLIGTYIQRERRLLIFGLLLLAAATTCLWLTPNVATLLVGRFFHGASAALLWTVGMTFVVKTVSPAHIGVNMGWIGLSLNLGTSISPLLGGVVYGLAGYNQVFGMCLGLVILDVLLRLASIDGKVLDAYPGSENDSIAPVLPPNRPRPGQLEDGASEDAPRPSDVNPDTAIEETAACKALIDLIRTPRLLVALWGTFVETAIIACFDSTMPFFVSATFGWGPIGTGIAFLAIAVPSFLCPLIGAWSDRVGPKWFAAGGFLLAAPMVACLQLVTKDSLSQKVLLCVLLAGIGGCMSAVVATLMAEITWAVRDAGGAADELSQIRTAYTFYVIALACGVTSGSLVGGIIYDRVGWSTVTWIFASLCLSTVIPHVVWTGGHWESLRKLCGFAD